MKTKAELEAELEALKAELAHQKNTRTTGPQDAAGSSEQADSKPEPGPEPGSEKAALADFLKSQGIDTGELDLEKLWRQLSDEMGGFARERPALAAVAVFALGFVLGRISK